MDEEQELTSLNWLLTSNVMPSGIETVPIEAPSSSLPANASSPALAPTKSKRLYLKFKRGAGRVAKGGLESKAAKLVKTIAKISY